MTVVLEDQLALLIADVAFLHEHKTPRTQIDFESRQQEAGPRIAAATQVVASVIPDMMSAYHQVRLALTDLSVARSRRREGNLGSVGRVLGRDVKKG